jgi:hypothetical protein
VGQQGKELKYVLEISKELGGLLLLAIMLNAGHASAYTYRDPLGGVWTFAKGDRVSLGTGFACHDVASLAALTYDNMRSLLPFINRDLENDHKALEAWGEQLNNNVEARNCFSHGEVKNGRVIDLIFSVTDFERSDSGKDFVCGSDGTGVRWCASVADVVREDD